MLYGILANDRFTYGLGGRTRKELCAIYAPDGVQAINKAVSEGKPIIPEGEKDADILSKQGYTAFSYGGVNDWSADMAQLCKGAVVYVLADNDEPGRRVTNIIQSDLQGIAESAKVIVPVPDIPKADISDYFATGHSKVEFGNLLQQNKTVTEESKEELKGKAKRSFLVSVSDVEEKEVEWLVWEYMPKGQINILAGDGGSGKTTSWCGLAAAVSNGTKVFFEAESPFIKREPQKVMFFSSEDSLEYTLKARLRKAGANLDNIYSTSLRDERFSQIKFNSIMLKDLIKEVDPALVIFDPIQAFIPPDIQMGQRNAMRSCLNPLIGLGEEYGTTFLIVVHTNKRQGVYGRNRIADSADVWDIARSVLITGTAKDNMRYLSHEKSNYGEPGRTVLYTIEDGIAVFKEYCDKHDADFVKERDLSAYQAPQRQNAEAFILDFLKNGKKPTAELDEAAKVAGISNATLSRAKTALRERGLMGMKSEGYGQNKAWYCYLIERQPQRRV